MCDRTGSGAPQAQAWQAPEPWVAPAQAMPAAELASSGALWVNRAEAGQPGVPRSAEAAPKGGFWMRLVAYLIDSVFIALPSYAVGMALLHGNLLTVDGISFLVEILYFGYYWSSFGKGQTIGMQLLHMKVVRTDGSLLTPSRAIIRFLGMIVAAIPFDIGLIWAAFDGQKQGWHDKIAGTYVITNW
jgi:uncharacterized RDD family membrane protein YckC